jgi:diadenosine tetraphosphate (Ap4A) HIT family hydrolase
MDDCGTCQYIARRDRGVVPLWDRILRTPAWDIAHCDGTDLPGWLVLVVRRHITTLADLSADEAAELGPLIQHVSEAVQQTVGCPKTYLVQFADHPDHPHVHLHVIPRAADLPSDRRGPAVFKHLGVPADRVVPTEHRNGIAASVRDRLLTAVPAWAQYAV